MSDRPEPGARTAPPVHPSWWLRPARPSDARALSVLIAGIHAEGRWFVGDEGPTADAVRRRLQGAEPAYEATFVAEGSVAPGLLGWIELHRYRPWRLAHVASLTVAVAAPARGNGIGRRLLETGIAWAERNAVRKVRLDVRAGNVAARRLYASAGFTVEAVERGQVALGDGRFEDNVAMARWLDGEGPGGG